MKLVVGYSDRAYDVADVKKTSTFLGLDPEAGRRMLAAAVAATRAGCPLGFGGTARRDQSIIFHDRHHPAAPGEKACCVYLGVRYAKDAGDAHAAKPGDSYHERMVPPLVKPPKWCLACDTVGKAGWEWMRTNAKRYGLRTFHTVGNEPWHVQPIEIPTGRRSFRASMYPLKVWDLPDDPEPQPARVLAPTATLAKGAVNDRGEVRELQAIANFYGWRDIRGLELEVDGGFGNRTQQATIAMQKDLGVKADGIYGKRSERALQQFLDWIGTAA